MRDSSSMGRWNKRVEKEIKRRELKSNGVQKEAE
jgi:hypothetical protein